MIAALIIAVGAIAYLAAALLIARRGYGKMRARSIEGTRKRMYCNKPIYSVEEAVEKFNEIDRGAFVAVALLYGATWPAAVPVVWAAATVMRWFDDTAVKSTAELQAERETMQARIRQLERELHIGEGT